MRDHRQSRLRETSRDQGANQTGVRAHNERLVLSLIRRHVSLPKAEIARRSGLSPQTVSVIIRVLEADDLLVRGTRIRGKIGQPSVPMSLNPDGAFSIGLKIGRRSAELILLDFTGNIREQRDLQYDAPHVPDLLAFIRTGIADLIDSLSPTLRKRLIGIGFGEPFELWSWFDPLGGSKTEMEAWRNLDLDEELRGLGGLPVLTENDATAACSAENIFGQGRQFADYIYLFIGYFAGGGVVLDHSVHRGPTGNAGALGSMLMPPQTADGPDRQLIECASLFVLEAMIAEVADTVPNMASDHDAWDRYPDQVEAWLAMTASNLARAAATACAVVDFEAVIIDGSLPAAVRARLLARVRDEIESLGVRGITLPEVIEGTIGHEARVLGAASLPFFSRYLLS